MIFYVKDVFINVALVQIIPHVYHALMLLELMMQHVIVMIIILMMVLMQYAKIVYILVKHAQL